ncbi:MAG TPA: alpha-amylase/4-alpha-glucanotransferase domain-containing protein [Chloroflexia bacterium]|nr:alpha-amylase/4-alpha-glucanotransferase domain-containing protein [Chloroflexia bacterium]
MKSTGNGHSTGNGSGQAVHEPHFEEDAAGATLDGGAAVCRFDASRGGRLARWQWRVVPPLAAQNPATRGNPPSLLDLVDPEGGALVDHFLPLGTKPEEFAAGTHREYGDFAEGLYKSQVVNTGGEIRIGLLRDGTITAGKRVAEVRMAKSAAVRPQSSDISVLYRVINSSTRPLQILFAVEFNLHAPGLHNPGAAAEGYYLIDGERPEDPMFTSMVVSPAATTAALVNPLGEMALQIGWDRECDLWRMPAGRGGVRLLAVWRLQLPPRDNWAMGLWLAPG